MKKKKKRSAGKQRAGKGPMSKAGLALKDGFYLEASWHISTILETRLRKIIVMVTGENPGSAFGLQKCLLRLKHLLQLDQSPLLSNHMEIRLIDQIRAWKNNRNAVYKDLTLIHVSERRMKKMTEEGILLHHEVNTLYKNMKKDRKRASDADVPVPETTHEGQGAE